MDERLKKQMEFLMEIDKLKSIFRRSRVSVDGRNENDAEHSWHLCMFAMVLKEYAPENTDVFHTIEMVLVHDLVEIYAGDTFLYDVEGNKTKAKREQQAADKLYAMLDSEQESYFKNLWYEFEACETNEALFANTLDRLQPIMLNYINKGGTWLENGVTRDEVIEYGYRLTKLAHPSLRKFALDLIDNAVEKGYLIKH